MKNRVEIPRRQYQSILDLANKIRNKHRADGDASPLKVMNWSELDPFIDEMVALQARAEYLKNEKLRIFHEREMGMEKLVDFLRHTRDILAGVTGNQMRELMSWGFNVIERRKTVASKTRDDAAGTSQS